jgi:PAS domain-containing protein
VRKGPRQERERLAVTLRSIGDGVITTNVYGEVVLINKNRRGAHRLEHRRRPTGNRFRRIFIIINEMTREPCENPVEKVLESGGIVGLANHTALIARDGTERDIADSGAPIRDREGSIIGVVLVFRDIPKSSASRRSSRKCSR